jgi:hypothetical protein
MTNKKRGISPVAAAVTGAVVGAGLAVAGAMVLKDEKNRKKAKKVLSDVKDQAAGYAEEIQKKMKDETNVARKKLDTGKSKVKKVVQAAKKAAR